MWDGGVVGVGLDVFVYFFDEVGVICFIVVDIVFWVDVDDVDVFVGYFV